MMNRSPGSARLSIRLSMCITLLGLGSTSADIPKGVFAHKKELPAPSITVPENDRDKDFHPAPEIPSARLSRYRFKPPAELIGNPDHQTAPKSIQLELQLNQLGRLHEANGDIEQALRAYRAAIQENPHFLLPYYNQLRIYRRINRQDQVRTLLRELLLVKPDDFTANTELSNFYFDREEYSKARPFYENLVKYFPKDGLSWHNLGMIAVNEGKADEAVACFTQSRTTSFALDYKNILGLPAFDGIRDAAEFQTFAKTVGADTNLTPDSGTTIRSILFQPGNARFSALDRQNLLQLGQALLDLPTDQSQEIVYNIAIYNGPDDMIELLQTKKDAIRGISSIASQSNALMILYSSSPDPLEFFQENDILPIANQAAEHGWSLQWYPVRTSDDLWPQDGAQPVPIFGIAAVRENPQAPGSDLPFQADQ